MSIEYKQTKRSISNCVCVSVCVFTWSSRKKLQSERRATGRWRISSPCPTLKLREFKASHFLFLTHTLMVDSRRLITQLRPVHETHTFTEHWASKLPPSLQDGECTIAAGLRWTESTVDKAPTLPVGQWTHRHCRPPLDWTNRSWQRVVFLQGRWRSDSAASDLRPAHRCVSGRASVSARVGRHHSPTPNTWPAGHVPLYHHTTPEKKQERRRVELTSSFYLSGRMWQILGCLMFLFVVTPAENKSTLLLFVVGLLLFDVNMILTWLNPWKSKPPSDWMSWWPVTQRPLPAWRRSSTALAT